MLAVKDGRGESVEERRALVFVLLSRTALLLAKGRRSVRVPSGYICIQSPLGLEGKLCSLWGAERQREESLWFEMRGCLKGV